MNMPRINKGYFYGQARRSVHVVEEASKDLTPFEKGEFRRAYYAGYCQELIYDLQSCIKYMRLEDRKLFLKMLKDFYFETLKLMKGEQGAVDFLKSFEKYEEVDEDLNL